MAKPSLAIGIAKVVTFFESANFSVKFSKNLDSSAVKELFNPPYPKGAAKVDSFFELANFSCVFFRTHFRYLCERPR